MRNENLNGVTDRYTAVTGSIDAKRIARVLWSRWYWVIGAVGLALGGCFLFLKLSKPRYVAGVTLRYNEKQSELDVLNQAIQPDMAGHQDYITERYVIESEEVIDNAISKLKNPFTFYKETAFLRRDDVYPFQPFTADILSFEEARYGNGTFEIKKSGLVSYVSEDSNEEREFNMSKDTVVAVQGLSFKVNSVEQLASDYLFTYNDLKSVKKAIDDRISVRETERNMPILEVSFMYNNQQFAQDFLDKLIESYGEYDLKQKRRSSDLTIDFIENQIKIYAGSLQKASTMVENYKQSRSVPNLESSMSEVMNKMSELETQRNTLEIQKSYIDLLEQNLSNRFEPINIGNVGLDNTSDAVLVRLVSEMNQLLASRKGALVNKYLSVNSPQVKAIDDEIERVREQILSNIKVQRQKNQGTLALISQNLTLLKGRMNNLPAVERQLMYLESDRAVNEKIYLLLLNKQIESSIVKAGILPSFNIMTRVGAYKTYPRALQVLLISLIAGLTVGVGSLFLARYLNNRFTEINEIGKHPRVNLLGVINRYPEKVLNSEQDVLNFQDNRSTFVESINSIRTNLSYLTEKEGTKGKLLVITSEISGEGKSFVTVNMAVALTKIGKKVLIIVSDLRRSKLHRFFNNSNKVGLSNYLSGKVADYHQVINRSIVDNLSYVTAGPVPFNPTELIQNKRFEQMIDDCLDEYDFVIVDTAPVGIVSDNILLLKKSDLVIYIIRWLYSSKEANLLPDQLANEYDLPQVGVIVNDFYQDDLYTSLAPAAYYASRGYGHYYKYSYQYYGKSNGYHINGAEKGSFWQRATRWAKKLTKPTETK